MWVLWERTQAKHGMSPGPGSQADLLYPPGAPLWGLGLPEVSNL